MVCTRRSRTIQHDEPVLSPQMTSLSPPFSHGRGRCDRVPRAYALRAFNSVLSTRYARHPRLFAPPISALIATRRSSSHANCNSKIIFSRSSHGAPCCAPAAGVLLQTLHLAASREDRLQMRQSTDRGRYRGGLGEIWASVIRSGDDAPGLSVGTCSAQRPGCQLGRARRSASVSWDVLGAAPLSVGTCSAQRLEPLAPHDPFPAALDHNEGTCMQGGRCNQHARWRCNQHAISGVGS